MRRKEPGRKPGTVILEIQALNGLVEVTAAWIEDKRARFPGADVLAVVEAYRARCETDPEERVTVWGLAEVDTRFTTRLGKGGKGWARMGSGLRD